MSKIKTYKLFLEGNKIEDKLNRILDKVSKKGISHLSQFEKDFLDSFSKGKEKEVYQKQKDKFIDSDLNVEFIYHGSEVEKHDDSDEDFIRHYGVMVFDDMIKFNGYMDNKHDIPFTYFEDEGLYDWDMVPGKENEYEDFIYNIFDELSQEYVLI